MSQKATEEYLSLDDTGNSESLKLALVGLADKLCCPEWLTPVMSSPPSLPVLRQPAH